MFHTERPLLHTVTFKKVIYSLYSLLGELSSTNGCRNKINKTFFSKYFIVLSLEIK